ncbi:MAG TPA: lanthionine synthetase LanC family protein [Chloroflexota bacterium]
MNSPDYKAAADLVGEWLLGTVRRGPTGWSWPAQPDVSSDASPTLYNGIAGPLLFFVEAYRTDGDKRWLEAARGAASWMSHHLAQTASGWAGCGLFTGIGGWAVVLDELASVSGDDGIRQQAATVVAAIMDRAAEAEGGRQWHELTEIIWGTAGIGCILLTIGRDYQGNQALELAARAGDWLISRAEEVPTGGVRWSLGEGFHRRRPGPDPHFPNFAHGTAGISFLLARLAQETDEERFLEAATGGAEWILSIVRTDDDTCAAYHHEPDGVDLYTLGWCHGPPGLAWLFRQLEITTGDASWRTWLRRAARTDRISGIPEQKEPGFWDNVARCCGSAGVAEFFLDLHRLEGQDDDLAFAQTLVDDLLKRAIVDEAGMRWSNYEYRKDEPHLPPETGYMQGASGIGSTLLRLHRHLNGDHWTVRWPHAPEWEPA